MTQSEGRSTTLVCLSWGDPAPEMTYRKEGHVEDYVMGSNVTFFCHRNTIDVVLDLGVRSVLGSSAMKCLEVVDHRT